MLSPSPQSHWGKNPERRVCGRLHLPMTPTTLRVKSPLVQPTLFARQARAAPVVVFLFRAEKRSFKLAESG